MCTPDDYEVVITIIGVMGIKKSWFGTQKAVAIYKYQGNDFVAYRRDFKPDEENRSMTSNLVVFHQKIKPISFIITSFVDNNDELFEQILSTIQ